MLGCTWKVGSEFERKVTVKFMRCEPYRWNLTETFRSNPLPTFRVHPKAAQLPSAATRPHPSFVLQMPWTDLDGCRPVRLGFQCPFHLGLGLSAALPSSPPEFATGVSRWAARKGVHPLSSRGCERTCREANSLFALRSSRWHLWRGVRPSLKNFVVFSGAPAAFGTSSVGIRASHSSCLGKLAVKYIGIVRHAINGEPSIVLLSLVFPRLVLRIASGGRSRTAPSA